MPARLFREGLLDSPRVCRLPLEARWLFVTICLVADDVGLFDAEPFALVRKAEIQRDLGDQLLAALIDADLIRTYTVPEKPGKRFGFIPRYGQRLRHRRIKFPLPPISIAQDDPDALSKFNDLASILRPVAATGGDMRPEPEVEVEEEKKRTPSNSIDRASSSQAPKAPAKAAKPEKKGSKMAPDTFLVTADLQRWARENVPLVDIREETKAFRVCTFKTARSDWPKTWQGWMLREQKRLNGAGGGKAGTASFAERASQHAASEAARWGGGLVADRKHLPETLEMEPPTHGRLDHD